MSQAADTRTRLARLLAAVMWDSEDHYEDVYERIVLQEDGGSPDVEVVELTEEGRIEILADGQHFVLSIEPADELPPGAAPSAADLPAPTPKRASEEAFTSGVERAARECGGMTLGQLRRIAERLANSCFTRYWINWFDAAPSRPALMALCAINDDGSPARLHEQEMRERGFAKRTDPEGLEFWFVRRVDEEGNPWRSRPPSG